MHIPFVNRTPNIKDLKKLALLVGVFGDGFGSEKDKWGRTRAGWKELERVVAEFFGGVALEQKAVFDVIIPMNDEGNIVCGFSVKTKSLTIGKFNDLENDGRVYIELNNSLSKLWGPIKELGFVESNFKLNSSSGIAKDMGTSIMNTVQGWYKDYEPSYQGRPTVLDLNASKHFVVSYVIPGNNKELLYQIHAFNLRFPEEVIWEFHSEKCLRGYEEGYFDQPLFEWYGLSGGQLKYYPRASKAAYTSEVFQVPQPKVMSITERSKYYWPEEWEKLQKHI